MAQGSQPLHSHWPDCYTFHFLSSRQSHLQVTIALSSPDDNRQGQYALTTQVLRLLTLPALMSAMELLFSRRALAKMAEMACWRIAKPMRMPCLWIRHAISAQTPCNHRGTGCGCRKAAECDQADRNESNCVFLRTSLLGTMWPALG